MCGGRTCPTAGAAAPPPPNSPSQPSSVKCSVILQSLVAEQESSSDPETKQSKMAAATSSNTSTATVSEGAIPSILLRGDAAAAREHQAHLIHGHEAHTQLSRRPDGLRGDREYHEVYEGGDPGKPGRSNLSLRGTYARARELT